MMSILLFRSKTMVVKNPMKGSEKLIESIEGKKLSYRMVGIGERVLHQGFSLLKPNCTIFPHKNHNNPSTLHLRVYHVTDSARLTSKLLWLFLINFRFSSSLRSAPQDGGNYTLELLLSMLAWQQMAYVLFHQNMMKGKQTLNIRNDKSYSRN